MAEIMHQLMDSFVYCLQKILVKIPGGLPDFFHQTVFLGILATHGRQQGFKPSTGNILVVHLCICLVLTSQTMHDTCTKSSGMFSNLKINHNTATHATDVFFFARSLFSSIWYLTFISIGICFS